MVALVGPPVLLQSLDLMSNTWDSPIHTGSVVRMLMRSCIDRH